MKTQYAVVCGSPMHGIDLHGPFDCPKMAGKWAANNIEGGWWAGPLAHAETHAETLEEAAPTEHEYLFDVKLFTALRVKAEHEDIAIQIIMESLRCATANLGSWPDGEPILAEVSVDGDLDLIEIGGEAV